MGLAQNCGKTLKNFFYFIDKIQNDFKKIYLFIGENESTDNTLEILKNYKNKKIQIKIINTSFLKKYSYRLEKMARARNYLAKFIKKINLDFVVCVDLDDVISNGINKKEFLNSLQILDKRNDLFGISAIF